MRLLRLLLCLGLLLVLVVPTWLLSLAWRLAFWLWPFKTTPPTLVHVTPPFWGVPGKGERES